MRKQNEQKITSRRIGDTVQKVPRSFLGIFSSESTIKVFHSSKVWKVRSKRWKEKTLSRPRSNWATIIIIYFVRGNSRIAMSRCSALLEIVEKVQREWKVLSLSLFLSFLSFLSELHTYVHFNYFFLIHPDDNNDLLKSR